MLSTKPYSAACERNREPLLGVLQQIFRNCRSVLELGSGTGQHAVYFAQHMPHLTWQTSDLPNNHAGIAAWLQEAQRPNALPPLAIDIDDEQWTAQRYDAIFSANTLHIVSWQQVERMFAGSVRVLAQSGILAVYGPFNYGGGYTSESNARFDAELRARDSASGIRDFENVDALARSHGLELWQDFAMPANNHTLVWRR